MPGATACLLGNLEARRELGKVGTQSDIHLHEWKEGAVQGITIVPAKYPDSIKPLSYAVLNADAGVLVIDKLTPQVGEQILAANAAGMRYGMIVLQNYLQPDQIKPLLKGTPLASWPVQTEPDWPAVRAFLAAAPPPGNPDGPVAIPIDHHFNVKGVGAVVLGVIKQGTLRKGDTLHAYPDKVICPVRSIQIHDVDFAQAVPGDRVGLSLRNTPPELLDRGMLLAPADAPVTVHAAGATVSFVLSRSPFARQPLAAGAVLQVAVGFQVANLRLSADPPGPGQVGPVQGTLERSIVARPGEPGVLWHQDAAPQRVVGGIKFS